MWVRLSQALDGSRCHRLTAPDREVLVTFTGPLFLPLRAAERVVESMLALYLSSELLVTNIEAMSSDMSRRERTRSAMLERALDLFEVQGYEQTSAAEVAAAAGVSEMTFFRHFPSKDRVLLDDPYDAELVAAVAARPLDEAPLARTVNGLRSAWAAVPEPAVDVVRRRARIVAHTSSLRSAVARNNQRTEDALAEQLITDGCDRLGARVVASAVLAALTSALLWWAAEDQADLSNAIERALAILDPHSGRMSR